MPGGRKRSMVLTQTKTRNWGELFLRNEKKSAHQMALNRTEESVNWKQSTWNHGFPEEGLGREPASSEDWSWWTADQKAKGLWCWIGYP